MMGEVLQCHEPAAGRGPHEALDEIQVQRVAVVRVVDLALAAVRFAETTL
jgi:hypothetical protein